MLINSVVLENWKSYGSATMQFTPGANAIIGQNGAGKSSILEAIGYVVFGAMPEGFKTATLVREGQKSGHVVVSLVAPSDDRTYEIERRFGSSGKYQVSDPELGNVVLASGVREVRQWVIDNLRLGEGNTPADLFEQTLGVPQGMITAAFGFSASDRKKIFDPLLKVDEYRNAAQSLNPAGRHLRDRTNALNERLAHIEGQLTRQPALLEEVTQLENRVAEDDRAATALAQAVASAQAMVDAQDALQAAKQSAETVALRAQNAHAMQTQALHAAQRDLAESRKARELVAAAEPGHAAYLEAQERLQALDGERRQRDKLLRDQNAAQTRLATLDTQATQIAQQLEQIAAAEDEVARLTPLVAQQDQLDQELAAAERARARLDDAQRTQNRIQRQRKDRESELARLQERFGQTDGLRDQIAKLESDRAAAVDRQAEIKGQGIALKAEKERIEEQTRVLTETTDARCPVCEAELTPQHRKEMIARNQSDLAKVILQRENAVAAYRAATDEIKRLDGTLRVVQEKRAGLPQQADLDRAAQQLDQAQKEETEGQTAVNQLAQETGGIDAIQAKLAELGDPRAQHAVNQSVAAQRNQAETNQAGLVDKQAAAQAQIAEVESSLAPLADLDERMAAAQAERDGHADDHNAYLTQSAAASRYDQRSADVSRLENKLAEAQATLTASQQASAQANAAYDANAHAQAREELAQAGRQQAAAASRLASNRQLLASRQQELSEMAGLEQDKASLSDERATVARHLQIVEYVQRTLRAAGPHITERKVQSISSKASLLFGDIMDDHRGQLRWDSEYLITLDVAGHERAFGQLSGGEQMTAALALRMALLQETSSLKLAFLDEPTAHMDETRRDVLAERILQVQGFDQLFVISHDDTFERQAVNFIHIVKDENGSHLDDGNDLAVSEA